MLVCNFERTTIFVSALSNPLSTSAKVIDSTVCVRLCSHAVGGRQGIHKQHRATFWWAMINELSGGWRPLAVTEHTFSHDDSPPQSPRLFKCTSSSSGLTATTQAQILLALPLSQSHSPTHPKTQSQKLAYGWGGALTVTCTVSKYIL